MSGERHTRRRTTWLAGAAAVVLAGAGIATWAVVAGGEEAPRTGPLSAAEVRSAATGFLHAWADGDAKAAASRTDDAQAARAALGDYLDRARIAPVGIEPGTARGTRVPYAVRAELRYDGARAPLRYDDALTVVRRPGDGKPVVRWTPSVLHPRLDPGERLSVRETGAAPVAAADRDGARLDTGEFPSLAPVVQSLARGYGKAAGGRPGLELRTVAAGRASGDAQPPAGETLLSVAAGRAGQVRTTIDPRVQRAAEREVARRADASIVVVRPSTGEILAVADSRTDGPATALEGRLAPGSTMKMITASLLLEKNLAKPDAPHPCPKNASYGGWTFHNVDDFAIPGGTFRDDFAASCNTAFITQAGKLADDDLPRQAREVFGIGTGWSVGVDAFDGSVPVQHDASKAAALIGQGEVRMNPLTMASVISTARTGTFAQPYLVDPSVGHRRLATARRTLDPTAHRRLRDLLHTTATSGSAAGAMAGLSGDIGAKTGSAEVTGQEDPNGWFAAWHGDLAAAAVMQRGGRGGSSSGPLVAAVLKAADGKG